MSGWSATTTTGRREARIVEVEAYGGPEDLASHARFGSTTRNRVMAGRPAIAYVYLVYGMYDCLNVVTEPAGRPSARADPRRRTARRARPHAGRPIRRGPAPTRGSDRRGRRRRAAPARADARSPSRHGPGLVGAAFGIDTSWTGIDLCDPASPLRLERDPTDPADAIAPDRIAVSPRVGVGYAGEDWAARPWRFAVAGHPSVSRPAPSERATAGRTRRSPDADPG